MEGKVNLESKEVHQACMFKALSKVLTDEGMNFSPLMDKFLDEYISAQKVVSNKETLRPESPDELLFFKMAYGDLPYYVENPASVKIILGKKGDLFKSGVFPDNLIGMNWYTFIKSVSDKYHPQQVLSALNLKMCKVYHEDLEDTDRSPYDELVMPEEYDETRKAYTYLFKITDTDGTEFYKRGWSYNPYKRILRLQKESKLKAELVTFETWKDRQEAFKMEQQMLSTMNDKQYTPTVKFEGYTECFVM